MEKGYESKNKLHYPPFIPFFVLQLMYYLLQIKKY